MPRYKATSDVDFGTLIQKIIEIPLVAKNIGLRKPEKHDYFCKSNLTISLFNNKKQRSTTQESKSIG